MSQSLSLLPPILENILPAIPYVKDADWEDGKAPKGMFELKFSLPIYGSFDEIQHVQLCIKDKATNNFATNSEITPDGIIYINHNIEANPPPRINGQECFSFDEDTQLCTLIVPYTCFINGKPTTNTLYNIQVRFGSDPLWCSGTLSGYNPNTYVANDFGAWRQQQVTEGNFGEWSNVAILYCYDPETTTLNITQDQNSFTPRCIIRYNTLDDDNNLEEVAINYQYDNMYGFVAQNKILAAYPGVAIPFTLPVAPVVPINIYVDCYTKYNVKLSKHITINPNTWPTIYSSLINGRKNFINITDDLIGEEKEDGVIAFSFNIPSTISFNGISYSTGKYSVYRVNIYSLEMIKVVDDASWAANTRQTFKDFSVEMGEEYQYIVVLTCINADPLSVKNCLLVQYFSNWGPGSVGYGRLMKMESVFLTTKKHQLRLIGNVKLGSLKRNVSDSFQTTIGSRYPFYSRSANTNYRTFTLEGLITILFDPTSTFFHHDLLNGLTWVQDGKENSILFDNTDLTEIGTESRLVILNKDLYKEVEHSLSRRRMSKEGPYIQSVDNMVYDLGEANKQTGPLTIYDNYLSRSITRHNEATDSKNELIYLERRFRDFVMEWLSNGKPKLFRSETEGNMIVMLTGVNFSPYDASRRMVYQMSATVTEIADYNSENLVDYDLLPVDITTQVLGFPVNLVLGDQIRPQDYNSLLSYLPGLRFFFTQTVDSYWRLGKLLANSVVTPEERADILEIDSNLISEFRIDETQLATAIKYVVETNLDVTKKINELLSKISNVTFIRGAKDPNILSNTDISHVQKILLDDLTVGDTITIDLQDYVSNITNHTYEFAIVEHGWPAIPIEKLTQIDNILQVEDQNWYELEYARNRRDRIIATYNKILNGEIIPDTWIDITNLYEPNKYIKLSGNDIGTEVTLPDNSDDSWYCIKYPCKRGDKFKIYGFSNVGENDTQRLWGVFADDGTLITVAAQQIVILEEDAVEIEIQQDGYFVSDASIAFGLKYMENSMLYEIAEAIENKQNFTLFAPLDIVNHQVQVYELNNVSANADFVEWLTLTNSHTLSGTVIAQMTNNSPSDWFATAYGACHCFPKRTMEVQFKEFDSDGNLVQVGLLDVEIGFIYN